MINGRRKFFLVGIGGIMQVLVVQCSKERKNRIPDGLGQDCPAAWGRVATVQAAVEAIRNLGPKVVIVDVEIENGRGFDVFDQTSDVTYEKVILTETPGYMVKCIRYDVAQYLLKPIDAAATRDAVDSLLFKQRENGIQRLFATKFNNTAMARVTQFILPTAEQNIMVASEKVVMVEEIGYLRKVWLQTGAIIDTTLSLARIGYLLRGHGMVRVQEDRLLQPQHCVEIFTEKQNTYARLCTGAGIPIPFSVECQIRSNWKRENGPASPRWGG